MKTLLKLVAGVCGGAAMTLASAGSAAPVEAPKLTPTGSWNLHRTTEGCYLVRSFGDGARQIQMFIQSYGRATPYVIGLRGSGLPLRDQRSEAVQIGFGGPKEAKTVLGVVGKADGEPAIVIAGYLPRPTNILGWLYYGTRIDLSVPVDPAARTLYVDSVDMEPITLELGSMEAEYTRLDECARTLEGEWMRAASGDVRPASEPKLLEGKQANWRTKYPENLLLNRISGLVQMRMTIDEDGRARDCKVQASIWAKRFGEAACAKLQLWGRFEPARDTNGKAIPALYRTAVIFAVYDA